jgi:hypothetical protein
MNLANHFKPYLCITLLVMCTVFVQAQKKEETLPQKINGISGKVTKKLKGLLYQHPGDTVMNEKSESGFMRYQGKIIRSITIEHIGFERNINDTTRYRVVNRMVRMGDFLHGTTKERVIRNNLFIHQQEPLDPHKLADNERHLRDLAFIKDVRIHVKPVRGNRDMVDVTVVTRDVFSLGGSFTPSSESKGRFKIYDANINGRGQRAQFNGVVDTEREPNFGYQLLYSKNSIQGSFIDATVSYTQINTGSSYGLENENAVFLKLNRPLVSPYTRWAGGMEFSRNWSENVYLTDETEFRKYTYNINDFWVGYNIGIKNQMGNRNRHFVAVRSFNQNFGELPTQPIEQLSPIYNDHTYVLGEISFYNQNFYRTKYVYGFGRTEDVPYGRKLTLLAGESKQLGHSRHYLGAEFDKSVFRKNGDFREYTIKAGGFKNSDWQDIVVLASASLYSKLIPWKKKGVRQSVSLSYTTIINHKLIYPLRIDNGYGINGFRADSLLGNKRLSLKAETVVFTKPTLAGFHFAPFVFADIASIAEKSQPLFNRAPYFGFGGGLRTRNENLIFGTIEMRMFYFPRVTEDLSTFRLTVSSNLRVKYSSTFVKAPEFIRYN